ncbi:unnamed protein product [Candida verbasci]|uniref:tRNA-dihydrouridine(47) synthase [NAD(P)(+)] n=1 Tax=Candida verbasci TaxID=1227364 RepID=A0A9W4XBY1_9ASCO|nr:unnamed protein product [Candida verbasci]
MTIPEKRLAEEEEKEVKKANTDTFTKGIAGIKPEFVVKSDSISNFVNYNDDEAEGGDRNGPEEKGGNKKNNKKNRGQNKKRDLKQHKGSIRLCPSLMDPNSDRQCVSKLGKECKFSHDINEYLQSKPEDIDGICPVYQALGYCPSGLKCRWLKSHYNKEINELIQDVEKYNIVQKLNYEVNKIDNGIKYDLQKKKYNYELAEPIIKFIDSLVNTEDNNKLKQEERKDNESEYHESKFKSAEKKKINLKNAKIVSPLTTVGNLPYRRLMKTLGADVTYSEMVLSKELSMGHNPEWALPRAHSSEYPGFGVQIAAARHWSAAKACEVLYKQCNSISEINLNCGCPIDLLYKSGQGSALMDQPSRLLRILRSMNLTSGDIPVTVKLRTGVKENKNTALNLVKRVLEEGNVAAITLHGRSRQQRYAKEADWKYIEEVGKVVKDYNENQLENKDLTDIQPTYFVGNGDVFSHVDWYNGISLQGVDSVMAARGALIKPWIFEEVEAQQYLDKSVSERLDIYKNFANFAIEHWGSDEYGVNLSRRFMCEFISFTHRYIPIGIMERLPPKLNERPPKWIGRNEMETLLGSGDYKDWIKITEMFLGKAGDEFQFIPKHKSNSYE